GDMIMSNVSVPKIPLSNFECVHCGRIYYDADLCSSDDCPGNDIAMPELLNGVGQELYRKLWSYIEATTDGEAPLAKVAWGDLTREHKVELVHAIQQEFPDDDI
ncbi:hypothetical protein, partial [Klebsiella pneumoniae]|uniref:hypothetical protein n=1 Tax=Klebsiella pneumoniae TaxID=573 RepID=UPI001D010675